jgi:hypothetical protein
MLLTGNYTEACPLRSDAALCCGASGYTSVVEATTVREISEAQRLTIELMRYGSYSFFDADEVADDLLAHADLWLACWWGDHTTPLSALASLATEGVPYADTLYLLTTQDRWEQLTELAQAWEYEEIYAVFQDSDEVLLIAYDEVYHTDPAIKPELEKALGRTLEELSDDLDVPALVLLEIWWD